MASIRHSARLVRAITRIVGKMLCIKTKSSLVRFRKRKTLWPHVVCEEGGEEAVGGENWENGVAAHGRRETTYI
jgi:hypothetical protein